jgi:predicted amidohydrolase YtcJ
MRVEEKIIVIKNADIRTMAKPARASAMAFTLSTDPHQLGTILATGKSSSIISKFSARAEEIIDLEGAIVAPGFSDSHIHFVSWARELTEPNLDGLTSLELCIQKLKQHLPRLSPGDWLTGGGWNWNSWQEKREPTRHDLDAIAPHTPIVLKSKDWHTLWCNTAALKILEIFDNPPVLKGGEIECDALGKPNGLLREAAAFHFMSKLPEQSPRNKHESILKAQKHLLSLGITTVHSIESLENFLFLKKMAQEGSLTLRVSCYILAEDLILLEKDPQQISRNPHSPVRIVGIKVFTDGSLGSRTAFLQKPYENSASVGMSTLNFGDLDNIVRRAEKLGLPCAVHAIGDAANKMVLDALGASRDRGFKALKHRIEHCQLLDKQDIKRFATLNVIASVQPSHLISDMDMVHKAWGKRGRYAYAFASLARAKAKLIFGSDAPVEPPNPLEAIRAATKRKRASDNQSFYAQEEKITFQQALRALTAAPANAVDEQSLRGSLAPGMLADFVCIRKNSTGYCLLRFNWDKTVP